MSILNDEDMKSLVSEERTYLGITWEDSGTDDMLKAFTRSSAKRLESIYGSDLKFTQAEGEDVKRQDALAHDLLLARVAYQREKALDDFEANYRSELLTLRNYGLVDQVKDGE